MRIVVAEDAALIRAGLIEVLTSAGHEVVGAVGDAEALESRVAALHEAGVDPDLVMSDVRMPPGNADDGLRAAIRLRRRHPGLPVLLLSAYIGGRYLRQLVQDEAAHGGIGYLMKERVSHVREFLQSLDVIGMGGVVIDPDVLHSAFQRDRGDLPGGRLSKREREVLELMSQGLSNAQISERLVLSPQAVSKHIASTFQKMDLPPSEENRRVRAVLRWIRARPDGMPSQ
ncbi:response regulator transcription factor [Brachybacterium alimentarium]|uniref:response regulator transcription factor n=1 Tax=Brachybacterium alimentarium TaxID=47845 RepID=UPI003FD66BF7